MFRCEKALSGYQEDSHTIATEMRSLGIARGYALTEDKSGARYSTAERTDQQGLAKKQKGEETKSAGDDKTKCKMRGCCGEDARTEHET